MTGGTQQGSDQVGQNYLASASDLVSALIFVFVIMLAVFALRLGEVREEWQSSEEVRDSILEAIAERLEGAGMSVEVIADQGVLRLSDNAINFASGRETPQAEHESNVGQLAKALAEVLPCYVKSHRTSFLTDTPQWSEPASEAGAGRPPYCAVPVSKSTYVCEQKRYPWLLETLLIEGHTDTVRVASGNLRYDNNLVLSSMRAAKVHEMITACEPGLADLMNARDYSVLSTSGYGETRPATRDPERFDYNRRIDLRFLLEPPEGVQASGESDAQAGVRERLGEPPR